MENFDGKKMKDFKKVKNLYYISLLSFSELFAFVHFWFSYLHSFSYTQQNILDVRKAIAAKLFSHPLNKIRSADVHNEIIDE